ncbi:MAG: hypothetical protein DMG07_26665 [Acidobacteria bacterium]|nr:MAG: hypothetical protein DMG07_26665 [Acidobacteriota bacterium]
MENLTHTLAGVLIARAGLEKRSSLALPALVVAALPDIDVFSGVLGRDYLDVHRGVTHGVLGIPVLAAVWTAALWGWSRFRRRDVAFVPLLGVVFVGLLSHPLLDLLNDYGIRPWLPFGGRKYYGDLVGVVDPWVWAIVGAGCASSARSPRARWGWLALGALLTALIVLGASPIVALWWWPLTVLLVVAGRRRLARGASPSRAALVVFFAYLAAVAIGRERVRASAMDWMPRQTSGPVRKLDVLPMIGRGPRCWRVIAETDDAFYLADDVWLRDPDRIDTFLKNLDQPCYARALADPHMAAMARFARFPSVDVRREENRCTVFLRDLRYARQSTPGWGVAVATVRAPR